MGSVGWDWCTDLFKERLKRALVHQSHGFKAQSGLPPPSRASSSKGLDKGSDRLIEKAAKLGGQLLSHTEELGIAFEQSASATCRRREWGTGPCRQKG